MPAQSCHETGLHASGSAGIFLDFELWTGGLNLVYPTGLTALLAGRSQLLLQEYRDDFGGED